MNTAVQEFVQHKSLAVAGASRSGKKFGNSIVKELRARGYEVFLVHPEAEEIEGDTCYPNLAALQGKIDGVVACLPPRQSEAILKEAASVGLQRVWLQQGAESPELLEMGRELGLDLVSGKCILMYAPPVRSIHWCHRTVVKLMGQL